MSLTQGVGIQVAVLYGGPSSEAEISRKSGKAVAAALRERAFTVHEIDFSTAALPPLPPGTQVVFPALHGRFGEDGELQDLLQATGMPFVGSGAIASRLIMDKQATKDCLVKHGLPVIPGMLIHQMTSAPPAHLRLPLIVKPNLEGSTIGLSKVEQPAQWAGALTAAMRFGGGAVVEAFIKGRECTVGLLDGVALPVVEIVPPGDVFDYDAKYTYAQGKTEYFCPPKSFSPALQKGLASMAEQAFKALGARDLLRVDFIVEESSGQPYILEGNSLPGFTATSLLPKAASVAGLAFPELCAKLVRGALARGP